MSSTRLAVCPGQEWCPLSSSDQTYARPYLPCWYLVTTCAPACPLSPRSPSAWGPESWQDTGAALSTARSLSPDHPAPILEGSELSGEGWEDVLASADYQPYDSARTTRSRPTSAGPTRQQRWASPTQQQPPCPVHGNAFSEGATEPLSRSVATYSQLHMSRPLRPTSAATSSSPAHTDRRTSASRPASAVHRYTQPVQLPPSYWTYYKPVPGHLRYKNGWCEVSGGPGEYASPQEAELADRAWLRVTRWHARHLARGVLRGWQEAIMQQRAVRHKRERADRWVGGVLCAPATCRHCCRFRCKTGAANLDAHWQQLQMLCL
jgi:hypothetical protein